MHKARNLTCELKYGGRDMEVLRMAVNMHYFFVSGTEEKRVQWHRTTLFRQSYMVVGMVNGTLGAYIC